MEGNVDWLIGVTRFRERFELTELVEDLLEVVSQFSFAVAGKDWALRIIH